MISCTTKDNYGKEIYPHNGYIDLSQWDFSQNGIKIINRGWFFNWKKFIDPQNQSPQSPDLITKLTFWNNLHIKGSKLSHYGYGTYRLKIKVPKDRPLLGFRFGAIATSYVLYVNGKELYKSGKISTRKETSVPRFDPHVAFYKPETDVINLLFHVSNFHDKNGGYNSYFKIGSAADISRDRELDVILQMVLFGGILIVALYHMVLFLFRRESLVLLYFGLYCFFISIFAITTFERYIVDLIPDLPWFIEDFLTSLSIFVSVPLFGMYIYELFPSKFYKIFVRVLQMAAVISLGMTFLLPPDIYLHLIGPYQILTIFACVFTFLYLIFSSMKHIDGALMFLFGFIAILLTATNDILKDQSIIDSIVLLPLGLFIFISVQAAYLSLRYSKIFRKAENLTLDLIDLNKNLEVKVINRTEELQNAMDEMEMLNNELRDSNELLEDAHRIAKRDMGMAVNVQQSILPSEYPQSKNWDVAFHFQPMSGISGDFFDFYFDNDDLFGLGLYDVSGHGIASGLVTMTAKTIIYRYFKEGKYVSLEEVMKKIHSAMIEEIGNTENYLSGILLRLDDKNIEYVNAGHPDPLVVGKEIRPLLKESGITPDGPFLGIETLPSNYEVIEFQLQSEEFIILYSDCLVEMPNSEGKSLEIDGLIKLVENISDKKDAQSFLNGIIERFYSFISKQSNLDDDLTVIVLRKK